MNLIKLILTSVTDARYEILVTLALIVTSVGVFKLLLSI